MTDEQIFEAIGRARAQGATEIGYTGGEPTVHRRFVEIVAHARELGFKHQAMSTNGIKLKSRDFCHALLEAGMTAIDFSVHGHTDEMHDALVGRKGALSAIREAVGHLRELRGSAPIHLSATTVLTSSNHQHLRKIMEMLEEIGLESKRIKHAFEGILHVDSVREQVAPYEDVIPSLIDALDYLATQPHGFQVTHIPLCLLGDHAVFSSDFERRVATIVFGDHELEGDPAQHVRSDIEACGRCALAACCTRFDDAYRRWYQPPNVTPFADDEVEALFERGRSRFPQSEYIIARVYQRYRENKHRSRDDLRMSTRASDPEDEPR